MGPPAVEQKPEVSLFPGIWLIKYRLVSVNAVERTEFADDWVVEALQVDPDWRGVLFAEEARA
jgi:hypothetical protein